MKNPKISIIIPTYNREDTIEETLKSVLAQTYNNWECLVVDDGSTDATINIIKDFGQKESRIFYYSRPEGKPKGASSCRNIGIERSTGDKIQFLDSDDLMHPKKIAHQMEIMDKIKDNSTVVFGRWGSFNISSDLKVKTQYKSFCDFRRGIDLLETFGKYDEYSPLHNYLVPRSIVEKSGLWNEDLSYNDDGEFFTRVLLNSSAVLFCPQSEVYYRASSSNRLSVLNSGGKISSAIKSWNLISDNIKTKYPDLRSRYVSNGINNLYLQVDERFSPLVKDNKEFFEKRFHGNQLRRIFRRWLKQ